MAKHPSKTSGKKKPKKQFLVGMSHKNIFYQIYEDALGKLIDKKGVKSVALEMPPLKNQSKAFTAFFTQGDFFYRLSEFARKKGCQVHHIDSRSGWESSKILRIAYDLNKTTDSRWREKNHLDLENILKEKKPIEWKAEQIGNRFGENINPYDVKFWAAALKLARTNTADELVRKIFVLSERRSRHMLKQVKRLKPEVIMVGFTHADEMAPELGLKPLEFKKEIKRKLGRRDFKTELAQWKLQFDVGKDAVRKRKLAKKVRKKIRQRKLKA